MLLECLKAILFGIVQGITEWLPVSSTGHMIILDEIVKLQVSDDFYQLFNAVIQLGSILAVIVLFFHKLNPFSPKKSSQEKKDTWQMWFKVIVGVIPLGIIGFLFDDVINSYLYTPVVVAIALIVYGILFIVIENRNRSRLPQVRSIGELSYQKAFAVGLMQVLALVPGTSRSGATILGGLLLGLDRTLAAEFSFFMAIPAMVGASGYEAVKYVAKNGLQFTSVEWMVLLVGTLVSFLVSLLVIRSLMKFIKKHDFKPFGVYRIVLGLVVLAYFLIFA